VSENAKSVIAFDYGDQHIGVAILRENDSPKPLTTIINDEPLKKSIEVLIESEKPDQFVVGWPRDINGNSTEQTKKSEQFADWLRREFAINVAMQDEALTSEAAKERINPKLSNAERASLVHQYAAVIILEDYLAQAH